MNHLFEVEHLIGPQNAEQVVDTTDVNVVNGQQRTAIKMGIYVVRLKISKRLTMRAVNKSNLKWFSEVISGNRLLSWTFDKCDCVRPQEGASPYVADTLIPIV